MDIVGSITEIFSSDDSGFSGDGEIKPPTNKRKIQEAVVRLTENHREEGNIQDEEEMSEIMENPYQVVEQYQQALIDLRPRLTQKIKENSPEMKDKIDVLREEQEVFSYIIEEEYVSGDTVYTVIGGSEPIRLNVCNKLEYGENEKELVRLVHDETAKDSFVFTSYTVNDEPLFIPKGGIKSKDEDI